MASLGVVLLFLASIWLVRWHNISRPNRELLKAAIDNAAVRFQSETGIDLASPQAKYLSDLLESAKMSSQEITGWLRVHEFERASIPLLASASISGRLQAVELELLDLDSVHAKALAAKIKEADEHTSRALLAESLTYLNDQMDRGFGQLVGWQMKAVWLAGVGCGLIVLLAVSVGNPILFATGAAGGYLSRLSRTLKGANVPTDYGASWTTLFFSPIVGALSGWFGTLLGAGFQSVQWTAPLTPITLASAFALGFSERLFDGIVASIETTGKAR
jgi:hypothetical protein